MDSSSDDFEDNELFFNTINSHLNVIIKFLVGISINLTLPQQLSHLFFFMMRLEVLILFATIFGLILFFHSFNVCWGHFNYYLLNQWIKKYQRLFPTSKIDNVSKVNFSQVDWLSSKNVGIYALQGRRPKMEDTFLYLNESDKLNVQLFGLFDGHGGDTASKIVQTRLLPSIVYSLKEHLYNQNQNFLNLSYCPANEIIEEPKLFCKADESPNKLTKEQFKLNARQMSNLLKEKIIELDKALVKEMKEKKNFSGTTALVAVNMIKENILIVANVGDSRAVLCETNGNVVPLSFDHKPELRNEKKRIKEAGGFISFNGVWRVAGILATSRSLGDYPLKANNLVIPDPDIFSYNLNLFKPHFMILASDGLWDSFSSEKAVDYVKINLEALKKNNKYEENIAFELAKNLALQSYKKGSLDNITVIIVLFDNFINKG